LEQFVDSRRIRFHALFNLQNGKFIIVIDFKPALQKGAKFTDDLFYISLTFLL